MARGKLVRLALDDAPAWHNSLEENLDSFQIFFGRRRHAERTSAVNHLLDRRNAVGSTDRYAGSIGCRSQP